MNKLEQELQTSIRNSINLTDIFRSWIVDNNPKPIRDKRGNVIGCKKSHADVGLGDLFVQCPDQRCMWIEVKKGSGQKLDPNQVVFRDKLQSVSGKYYQATSMYQALMALEDHCKRFGLKDRTLEALLEAFN